MPELAEVEYYRKRWDGGIGGKILRVHVHAAKRVFRQTDVAQLQHEIIGATLLRSEARGKKMMFRFSNRVWLGLHLGMTGKLSAAPPHHQPGKHDHLILYQKRVALVFSDMRQFGRVLFAQGDSEPEWWSDAGPAVGSKEFSKTRLQHFLKRHGRQPIKATLLSQTGFPGVGNWMADEILWRGQIPPRTLSGRLKPPQITRLWREARYVCRQALRVVGHDFSDPPKGWLFHERWKRNGVCPVHKSPLTRETVGGRTTAWCPKCQPPGG